MFRDRARTCDADPKTRLHRYPNRCADRYVFYPVDEEQEMPELAPARIFSLYN
jgi:hypothetical protein